MQYRVQHPPEHLADFFAELDTSPHTDPQPDDAPSSNPQPDDAPFSKASPVISDLVPEPIPTPVKSAYTPASDLDSPDDAAKHPSVMDPTTLIDHRYPDLVFPEAPPPAWASHLMSRYLLNHHNKWVWTLYETPLTWNQETWPSNLSRADYASHWHHWSHRLHPPCPPSPSTIWGSSTQTCHFVRNSHTEHPEYYIQSSSRKPPPTP